MHITADQNLTRTNERRPAVTPEELVAAIACLVAVLGLSWRYLQTALSPLVSQLEFLTDDGFYYLVLAKNFDALGKWTFDGGVSLTSGFHPLFAYILVLLHKLFPGSESFVQAAVMLQCLSLLLILGLAIFVAWRTRTVMLLLSFLAVLVTGSCFMASQALVEWPFVLLISMSLSYLLWKRNTLPLPIFFGIGFLGEVARSDWILWPVSLAFSAAVVCRFSKDRQMAMSAAAAVVGAVMGLVVVFLHSTITTGQIAQGSALMKSHWSAVANAGAGPILKLLGSILPGCCDNILCQLLTLPAVSAIFLTGIFFRFQETIKPNLQTREQSHYSDVTMVLASLLSLLAYLVCYSFAGGGIAVWYSQSFIVPLTVLYGCALEAVWKKGKLPALGTSVLLLFAVTFQTAILVKLKHGIYTWHPVVLQAARYIENTFPNQRVGAFNAGILGYFAGNGVTLINLDGLVNNDIYQFAVKDKFYDYVVSRKLNYLADWPEQIRTLAPYCGFSDGKLLTSLKPVKVFDDPVPNEVFKSFTIYQLVPSPTIGTLHHGRHQADDANMLSQMQAYRAPTDQTKP